MCQARFFPLAMIIALSAPLCPPTHADPTDLDHGALIAHYVPEMDFSTPPAGGFCSHYVDYHAITHHTQQVNRIDAPGLRRATWFVLAAWEEPKTWCQTIFGLGDYDYATFGFLNEGACFPEGGMTLPTAGWPGPNEGVVLQTTTAAWTGNYVPVYFFNGYAYTYGEPQIMALVDPPGEIAGMMNCAHVMWAADQLGGMGIDTDGIYARPGGPMGACCVGTTCQLLPENECLLLGGYAPGAPTCDPNPCDALVVQPDGLGEYPTIQAAVDAAHPGQEVTLTDGVFTGPGNWNVDFLGKAITVRSQSEDAQACVIDCAGAPPGASRGVLFHSGEDTTSVLANITIRNAQAASGAGVYIEGASPKLLGCIVTECHAENGAAVHVTGESSGPVLERCVFSDNHASSYVGGVSVVGSNVWTRVRRCEFTGNGGGAMWANGKVRITDSVLRANHGTPASALGLSAEAVVERTTFAENEGENTIYFQGWPDLRMQGCTMVANQGNNVIYTYWEEAILDNCIIAFNDAQSLDYFVEYGLNNYPVIHCCDFFGNTGGDWTGLEQQYHSYGNLCQDPLFCDVADFDFRLHLSSPCAPPAGSCGLIGAWPAGCSEDMRACCVGSSCSVMNQEDCDLAGGVFMPGHESCDPDPCPMVYTVAPDGSGTFPTIQAAVDAATNATVIELLDGTFTGAGNRDIVVAGKTVRIQSASDDPDACVIECEGSLTHPRRGFAVGQGAIEGTVLRGFTIRGGYADQGGGLFCEAGAAPALENLVLASCAAQTGGGGIACQQASLRLQSVQILDCSADSGFGGGLNSFEADISLADVVFARNEALLGGGGLSSHGGSVDLLRTTFAENGASGPNASAGGARLTDLDASIKSCTFHGNSGEEVSGLLLATCRVDLEQSMIVDGQGGRAVFYFVYAPSTMSCCNIHGNEGGDWVHEIAQFYGMYGNICADPLFCDAAHLDFRLQSDSPCAPFSPPNPACDLIGAWPVGCDPQAVEEPAQLDPTGFCLAAPGPLGERSWITYEVPASAAGTPLSIAIFDITGRQVRALLEDATPPAGRHRVLWDGRDNESRPLPRGVYYARLLAGATELRRRLVLVR